MGALHGLPFTAKDHICVKGLRNVYGVAKNLFNPPAPQDSLIVEILRNKGAIPIAKSNIPVCCGGLESGNNIYGDSKNPWDIKRSPGGSSGGEACLISSRCSVLGVGSDAAGSLRIPAAFTGIYSFVPTWFRSSNYGNYDGKDYISRFGCHTFASSLGPMGRNTEDLKLVLENLFGEYSKKDFHTSPQAFNYDEYNAVASGKRKLKIGVI